MNMSEDAGARLRGAASRKTRGYRRCAGMASCTRMAEPEQPTDTPSPNCLLLAQHVIGGRSQHACGRPIYVCSPRQLGAGDVSAYRLLQCASRPEGSSGVGMTTLRGTRIRPIVFICSTARSSFLPAGGRGSAALARCISNCCCILRRLVGWHTIRLARRTPAPGLVLQCHLQSLATVRTVGCSLQPAAEPRTAAGA